ncbi:hypothetical protein RB597_005648 [Gaeumannomyces tritici]
MAAVKETNAPAMSAPLNAAQLPAVREQHERWMRPKRIPFHTDEPMSGPARYSWADLRKPLLRKCPLELKDIRWLEHLGGGYDGYCWKVAFGNQGPFVVKLFWDDKPPENMYYWAAQREFQNAAVLQMMEASLGDLGDGDGQISRIRLYDEPRDGVEAVENLYAFSQEARKKPRIPVDIDITCTVNSMPRTRKCFGWLKLSGEYFNEAAQRKVKPPILQVGKYRRGPTDAAREYFAIVYEYIEAEQGDDDADFVDLIEIQASMEFLWTVGFEFYDTTILDNWKRSVLIDLSDIIFPLGYGRHRHRHYPANAKSLRKQGEVIGNPRRLG